MKRIAGWRYRLADRIGRALLGGRLAALDASLERRIGALERGASAAPGSPTDRSAPDSGDPVASDLRGLAHRMDALERRLVAGEERAQAQRGELIQISRSWLYAVARETARRSMAAAPREVGMGGEPAVTVVTPIRNRAHLVGQLVACLQAQTLTSWELVFADDGSTDDTPAAIERQLADPRVRLARLEAKGPGAARNHALALARGAIVVYLDSDVTLFPDYLAHLVAAYAAAPEATWGYAARCIEYLDSGLTMLQFESYDRTRLERFNFIDTNVLSHRRGLEGRLGAWDETLRVNADWELALRWSGQIEPRPFPLLACRYTLGAGDQLSICEPAGYDNHLVLSRHRGRANLPLKVLYAVERFPELSATFVDQEIRAAQGRGAQVEVWAAAPATTSFPSDVRVHAGDLASAALDFRPDLIHVHGAALYFGAREAFGATGLPLTVRAHGDGLSRSQVAALESDSGVSTVFLPPYFVRTWSAHTKVVSAHVGFRPDRYFPEARKDRRLVFRATGGAPNRNLGDFVELARRNPSFHFVLAAAVATGHERWLAEFAQRNRSAGSPVDLRLSASHDEVAALSRQAGIYLYTHALDCPVSPPISILEAMATGSAVFVPDDPALRDCAGEAADYYRGRDGAERLLRSTLGWTQEEWQGRSKRAIDRAFNHFESDTAVLPVLKCWAGAVGQRWEP